MSELPDVEEVQVPLDKTFDLISGLLRGTASVRALVARGEHERAMVWRARVLDMVLGDDGADPTSSERR
jgi:hypothetical protein